MMWLRAVWHWLRRWWAALVVPLGVLAGSLLVWGTYRRNVTSFGGAMDVERAKRAIAALRSRRGELKVQTKADELELARIDIQLEINRQRIEAVRKQANVPVEQLAKEFKRLGY